MSNARLDMDFLKDFSKGISMVCDVVSTSYGVNGSHILINDGIEQFITNDGITIAKYISEDSIDNKVSRMGVKFAKDVLRQIDIKVKNGTTTGCIMLRELVDYYISYLKDIEGYECVVRFKRDFREILDFINKDNIVNMFKIKKDDNNIKLLENVLFGSCRDKEMTSFIKDTLLNKDLIPVVSWEKSDEYKVEKTLGSSFYFTKMNNMDMTNSEETKLIIFDGQIDSINYLRNILAPLKINNLTEYIVVCRKFEERLIPHLGNIEKDFKCKITFYAGGEIYFDELEDMAQLLQLERKDGVSLSYLLYESSSKVQLDKDKFTIIDIDNEFNKDGRKKIVDKIKEEIGDSSDFKKNNIKMRRIGRYSGYQHSISIKSNDTNLDSQYDKYTDTINTGRNFINNSHYAVGGGVFHKDIGNYIDEKFQSKAGEVVMMGLVAPFGSISGRITETIKLDKVNWGLNALDFKIGDMSKILIDDLETNVEVMRIVLTNFVNIVVGSNGVIFKKGEVI